MNDAIFLALIGIMAAPLASFITWMANRKKNMGEMYSTLTDSAQSAVETMQTTMETLHEELRLAQAKIDKLVIENKKMQEELVKLRNQNLLLLEENHILHNKLDDLTKTLKDYTN